MLMIDSDNPHRLSDQMWVAALANADRLREQRANVSSGIVPPTEYLDFLLGEDQSKGASYDDALLEANTPPFLPDFLIFHPGRMLAALVPAPLKRFYYRYLWAPTSEEMHND